MGGCFSGLAGRPVWLVAPPVVGCFSFSFFLFVIGRDVYFIYPSSTAVLVVWVGGSDFARSLAAASNLPAAISGRVRKRPATVDGGICGVIFSGYVWIRLCRRTSGRAFSSFSWASPGIDFVAAFATATSGSATFISSFPPATIGSCGIALMAIAASGSALSFDSWLLTADGDLVFWINSYFR